MPWPDDSWRDGYDAWKLASPDDYYGDHETYHGTEDQPDEEEFYAMYDAFEPLLKAVMAAFKKYEDPGTSDLYDEQPITLTIHCTLGDIRKARSHMRHEPPQEDDAELPTAEDVRGILREPPQEEENKF